MNPAGVIFGSTAVINTGGFVAAAGTITNQNFLDGNYQFNNLVGGVENYGRIQAPVVALVGRYVTQAGFITGGQNGLGGGNQFGPADVVILAAGESVLIGEAFGSVFVSAPPELGPGGEGDGGSLMGAGDVFSIAAWHANRGNTSANTVRIASRGTATLEGTINASQLLEVNALNDLNVNGTIIAGNALLRSDLGGVGGSGVISTPTLAIEAQGDISLDGANGNGNQVGTLDASSVAGGVLFVNDGDLTVNSLSTGPGQNAEIVSNTGSLNMAGGVNAGSLELRALDGAVIGEGTLTAAQLEAIAGLNVDLRGLVGTLSGEAGATGGGGANLGSGHSFVFDNESGTLNINGISATLDVLITSGGGIAVVGGTINAGNDIRLTTSGGDITALGGNLSASSGPNGDIVLDAAGDINATQQISAGNSAFLATGSINASNMSVNSTEAQSTGGGNINLNNSGALLVNGVTTTGDVSITSTGEMTIALQIGGDVVTLRTVGIPTGDPVEGPAIVIEARVEALSELTMTALGDIRTQNGGIVQSGTADEGGVINAEAGGDVSLDIDLPGAGSELSGTAGGDMDLTVFGDSQLTLGEINVGGGFTLSGDPAGDAGGFDLVINNVASGVSIVIGTGGTITVNGNVQAGVDQLISLTGQKGIILNPGSLLDFAGGGIDRRVLLRSTATIAQSGGGGISAGQLQALGSLIELLGSNNQVSRFAADADNGVDLANNTALEIGTTNFGGETTSGIAALFGDITVNNDGTITVSDAVFSILGNATLNATNGSVLVNSDVSANGNTTIRGQNGVDAAAGTNVIGANVLIASSDGSIELAGFVDGNNQVLLDANGDAIVEIGGLVRGETVGILSELGDIVIEGDTESNNLTYMRALAGEIRTAGAGLITSQQLQVIAALMIDITAEGSGGVPLTIAGRSQTSDISLESLSEVIVGEVGSPIALTGGLAALGPGGEVSIRSLALGNAGISVLQPIRAEDTVRLDTRGALTASGFGRIIAPNLIIGNGVGTDDERPSIVDLLNVTAGGDTNEVAVLDVQANGRVLFRNDGALLIQRIATNDFVLVLNDGTVQVVEIETDASGDVAIVAENGDIELLGGAGNSGIVAAGQTVVLDARSNGAQVFDAGTGEAFGTITAAQLKVLADSGIFLDADHTVGTLAAQTRRGDLRFFNTGSLQIGAIGPVADVPGDAALAGVTTLEALSNDLIRIESGNGSIFVDQDVATFASPALLPPDNRFVELRADNGAILGLGRIISPRLEAFSRNGIELQGDNVVGTLLAETTGGFGPFPPQAPNGIVFYNISDLIVESAEAPNNIQISAEGDLRFQRAIAGGSLAGHAGGDLIVEAAPLTLGSGSWMSLYALNDVIFQDGALADAGTLLTVNAQRDILQGLGGAGAEALAGSNVLYEAGRVIHINDNSSIVSGGALAHLLAGGEVGGVGIRLGQASDITMINAGGVLLDAAAGGIVQAGDSSIVADRVEALAALGVELVGENQVNELAGVAGDGSFLFDNTVTPLLTIAQLNLDGMGPNTVGVTANNGDVQINTSGGSMLVANPVNAIGGNAGLTAQLDIDVPSTVVASQNATLFAQGGSIGIGGSVVADGDAQLDAAGNVNVLAGGFVQSGGVSNVNAGDQIDIAGFVDAAGGSNLFAGTNIDISGGIFGGTTIGEALTGQISISGIIDVGGNAIMTASDGSVFVTNTGQITATGDAALIAADDIDMAGTISATLAELNAGGLIDGAGSINADQLIALANLGISLTGGNVVANFAGETASGDLFFNNSGALVITNLSRAGGGSATGARAVNGTITIINNGGTVTVDTVSGPTIQAVLADIRVTGGQLVGSGVISTPQLRALATQGISLTGNNIVGTLAAGSNGAILFNNAGDLIIGDVTGTNGITTVGVQSPSTVSLFSQNGDIDIQSELLADRLNLVARQGGLTGVGNINASESFLLAQDDINLLNANANLGNLAASSLGGSVRLSNNTGVNLERLTLSESLRQIAGITAEQAVINGLFANEQIKVRANGNIIVNVDQLIALNAGNAQGNQDAIILDTGYSAANPNRSIVINGLSGSDGMVELITQGNGGNVRLLGNVTSLGGRSLSVWAGPNGTVEFAGNVGSGSQRLGTVVVSDLNNDLQSFRDSGNTIFRGDVFVADRLLVQGDTTIGERLFGSPNHTIDVAGGIMELFGNVLAGGPGQTVNFLFDLNQQYEVLSQMDDEFAVRVPLRFYGSIGTEANPFEAIRLGGDLNATLASTMAFIDRDLRLDDNGQFDVDVLTNIHTDQAFNIWTNDGLTMGDGQRMLVLGDMNIRSNNLNAQNFLSDITVVGTPTLAGFVGGDLRIDGDTFLLTRPLPLTILDRFTVLPSNATDTRVQEAVDLGVDLIATDSIEIFGTVQRIVGRTGNAFLSTQSGGNISVFGSDFAFRTFGGSVGMGDALITAGFPGSPEFRFGPVVALDLVATGPTNDNLGEALADALPDLETDDVTVSVELDARDIEVLQRELGLSVETTPVPSDLTITTGQPRANAPTGASVADEGVAATAPPVIRERVSPEGVRQVVVSIFDAFGTAETIDTVRFPEFGDRQLRFQAFADAFQSVYDERPDLGAFRSEVFADASEDADAAVVADMLSDVDSLMRDVRDLGLTPAELETIHAVLADRFLNQAGLSEQFAGDTAFNAAIVRELLGFPPAGTDGATPVSPDATVSTDSDRPAVSLRTNRR